MGFKGSKVQTFSSRPTGKSGAYVKTWVPFFVPSSPVVHPPPCVTGQFRLRPATRLSPFGALLCRLTYSLHRISGNNHFFRSAGCPPGRTRRRRPSPAAPAAPALCPGVSFRPEWDRQDHVFITGGHRGSVFVRLGSYFLFALQSGLLQCLIAACVKLGMLSLLHPIQNGLQPKIPYDGKNLQPVCSVRLHRLRRLAVFLRHT